MTSDLALSVVSDFVLGVMFDVLAGVAAYERCTGMLTARALPGCCDARRAL
jgi:hypothetical protein